MERCDLTELHFLTPIQNLPSIMANGILSHVRAAEIEHDSLADEDIQRRRNKRVPQGRPLHEYANLYVCGRGPMLFKRLSFRHESCVLRVSPSVLDVSGVIITDKNAAGDYVRFAPAPGGLEIVDRELTFAKYWTDDDIREYFIKKAAKSAEVLVPDAVDVRFINGAYVCSQKVKQKILRMGLSPPLDVSVNRNLFFGYG